MDEFSAEESYRVLETPVQRLHTFQSENITETSEKWPKHEFLKREHIQKSGKKIFTDLRKFSKGRLYL